VPATAPANAPTVSTTTPAASPAATAPAACTSTTTTAPAAGTSTPASADTTSAATALAAIDVCPVPAAHHCTASAAALTTATAVVPDTALRHGTLQHVDNFSYLGSIYEASGSQERELNRRIAVASGNFRQLQPRVFSSKSVKLSVKMQLYKTIVVTALMYGGGETWVLSAAQQQRLNVFNTSRLRRILGISLLDHVSNEDVYSRTGQTAMSDILRRQRLRWLGHVARRQDDRVTKQLLFAHSVPGASRARGRPPASWRDIVRKDLKAMHCEATWYEQCQIVADWNRLIEDDDAAPR
jgi:hypothetical protein